VVLAHPFAGSKYERLVDSEPLTEPEHLRVGERVAHFVTRHG
jgi:hypothetical protein